jgi:NADH-quinone oxidoreductase subunit G
MTEAVKPDVKLNLVNLTIDEIAVQAPQGTLVVEAARQAGVDIPVFCYHPKMEPVGMCRMCLVDIGLPQKDRATGELVTDESGEPVIQFGRTLMTGCTERVQEGMVVVGYTEKVQKARKDVLEFLLTSHPLDCPICDKGGECPLQNLTMEWGPGESRFIFDEKIKLDKHVPLGDLIFLDRERCIQCARCTRFQDEIVDDPVIGFNQRGRSLMIVTFSDPGFDSYWSGNTTDICPVGALTTSDFRFGARPWEMQESASICNHCAVGCNTTLNTRREAKAGGDKVIKRVMPRQNEQVNEIWLCDKGRFAGHHYTEGERRITQPLVREGDALKPVTWDQALKRVAEKLSTAGSDTLSLVGGRLSNEDLFNIKSLSDHLGGAARLVSDMAGGDHTAAVGVGVGTNFSDLGKGDAVLVIAADLEEEAPLYWLRVKQAAQRGATLIVANPRSTKLDRYATHNVRYAYGEEAALAWAFVAANSPKTPNLPKEASNLLRDKAVREAGDAITSMENLVVIYGSEGTGYTQSADLSSALGNLLIATGHVGKPNSGLVAAWDSANAQGAWDMGVRPSADLAADLSSAKAIYIAAADPFGDQPALTAALERGEGEERPFLVVQDIALSATAEIADVILPVAAYTERDGTYTNAERRVQRFYPAVPVPAPAIGPDFAVTAKIASRLGLELEGQFAVSVFNHIAEAIPAYAGLNYAAISAVEKQLPTISEGRDDVYYGGTTYTNEHGLGVQLPSAAERGESPALTFDAPSAPAAIKGLKAVPITVLYDQGGVNQKAAVLQTRLAQPFIALSSAQAKKLKLADGEAVQVTIEGITRSMAVRVDESLLDGVALVPRSMGLPIYAPVAVEVKR